MLGRSQRESTTWTRYDPRDSQEDPDCTSKDEDGADQIQELYGQPSQRLRIQGWGSRATQSITSMRRCQIRAEERKAIATIHRTFRDLGASRKSCVQTCVAVKILGVHNVLYISML